jgi:hypothetical protein
MYLNTMEASTEEFINIWHNYSNVISVQPPEFDKYVKVINKVKNANNLDIQEKQTFIELIHIVAETIYTINNCDDKYKTIDDNFGMITYYQQTKIYDEPELNCCSNLLNKLESDIWYDWEDKYEAAFSDYTASLN